MGFKPMTSAIPVMHDLHAWYWHLISIMEVMGWNPVEATSFFLGFICSCFKCFVTARSSFTCILYLKFSLWDCETNHNGSHAIITTEMMCNHNIISRNEKNRSKVVILQSFSVLCYMFRKWEHFRITTFHRLYMAGGQPLPSSNSSHTNLSVSRDLNCHETLYFNGTLQYLKLSSTTFFCSFHF